MGVLIFWSILIGIAEIGLSDAALCQGRNFVLSSSKSEQANAKTACGGGNLASIPDEATQNHLSTLASNMVGNGWMGGADFTVYAYIGGERTGNDFKWPDGTIFSTLSGSTWSTPGYNGWIGGSGPSGGGTCMVFTGTRSGSPGSYTYTWKWGNAACTGSFYYICEYQDQNTPSRTIKGPYAKPVRKNRRIKDFCFDCEHANF